MKYFKKLIGERIYLSPRNVEDAEIFTEWFNDFETTDYVGMSNRVISLENEKEYLEKSLKEKACFFIVTLDEDKVIGSISIENISNMNRTGTIGILIGEKDYRSKGYGTEAIQLLLDYGFNYLNLNNINLDVLEVNERAINCYIKCGFKEYGRRRKCRYINGKYLDVISMDILAEEFTNSFIKNKNI
ncbi:MAG: GNAT family N-acetyltransferase [Clostridiales bacterium]|nr:GNAT family N-acetyltransferase [Clostridiales bacterium]